MPFGMTAPGLFAAGRMRAGRGPRKWIRTVGYRPVEPELRACVECGVRFLATHNARTCSNRCYQRGYKRRERAGLQARLGPQN
jgi:ribosomal protein S27AE